MNAPINDAPRSPQQVGEQLSQYLADGNVDGALSLFEDDSIMFTLSGEVVSGLGSIRKELEKSVTLNVTLELGTSMILEADGAALVSRKWAVTGTRPDGEALELSGHGADVVRRQPDGSWRYLIDNPRGTDM